MPPHPGKPRRATISAPPRILAGARLPRLELDRQREAMNGTLLLSTLNLCLGGLVFLLGFVIYRENPGQRLNRLVALMLFFGGFGAVLGAFALMASRSTSSAIGAQAVSQLLQSVAYVWEFYFPTLFMFASIFPEE